MWHPIETAPKDGRDIIAYDNGFIVTAWVDDVWTVQGGKGGPSGWFSGKYRDRWGDHPMFDNPTHWLPATPPE